MEATTTTTTKATTSVGDGVSRLAVRIEVDNPWLRREIAARLGLPLWSPSNSREPALVVVHGRNLEAHELGLVIPKGESAPSHPAAVGFERVGVRCLRGDHDLISATERLLTLTGDPGSRPRPDQIAAPLREAAVVDRWWRSAAEVLVGLARRHGLQLERISPWPGGRRAVVFLSHDVDLFDGTSLLGLRRAYWQLQRLRAQLRGDQSRASFWRQRLNRWASAVEDPHFTIPALSAAERARGVRSTFFFFSRVSPITRQTGRGYSMPYNGKLRRIIQELVAQEFEVTVHGSHADNTSSSRFLLERRLLERISRRPARGIRQHRLLFQVPATWQAQRAAGYEYDASVGWNTELGFRAGTCLPFSAPAGPTLIPLLIQDGPLRRNEDDPRASVLLERVQPLVQEVKAAGGVLSVLMHPDYWDEHDYPGFREFYLTLLDQLVSDPQLWFATGTQITSAWQAYLERLDGGGQ